MSTTWRLVADDGQRDPRVNLALEEAMARAVGDDPGAHAPVMRIWRSNPSVVVGRFQVASAEVDRGAAALRHAPVLRRFTGGGTVWHDPGNVNLSLVLRPDDPRLTTPGARLLPGLYQVVLGPLAAAARALGATDATATDRDVITPRGKLSGIAAWIGGRAILVHGTLLVDADLDALAAVCAGPGAPGDPRWERTKSRRVAVTSVARERALVGLGPPRRRWWTWHC